MTAELETRWNRALQRVQEIEHKLAQHDMASPAGTPLPTEDLAVLGANLERIWFALSFAPVRMCNKGSSYWRCRFGGYLWTPASRSAAFHVAGSNCVSAS
ncbi:transposase [Donghicola eburneus]|uniref:Transposase n=1 Tax=Donghicola eburneus TaxID=393278 RepID=A0A1M4MVZ1_9RHOB|nr:transposase [Donghicola eburneus]